MRLAILHTQRAVDEPEEITFLLNGKSIDSSKFDLDSLRSFEGWTRPEKLACHILDKALAEVIGTCRLDEVDRSLSALSLPFHPMWNQFIDRVYFIREGTDTSENWKIAFSVEISPDDWANPYTISAYDEALSRAATDSNDFAANANLWGVKRWRERDEEDEYSGISWSLDFSSGVRAASKTIREEMGFWSEKLKAINTSAVRDILKDRKDALVTFFEFPPLIKTSCEQYLMYFVQFLEDLGIRADSEIKRQAGQVMFAVAPKDGDVALTKIKEALQVYLRLPLDPTFNESTPAFSGYRRYSVAS
jgi:hypothetical protein